MVDEDDGTLIGPMRRVLDRCRRRDERPCADGRDPEGGGGEPLIAVEESMELIFSVYVNIVLVGGFAWDLLGSS